MIRWLIGLVVVGALAVGLWAFEPWRLFTSSTVHEDVPVSTTATEPAPPETQAPAPKPTPRDRELARGRFEDAEHGTSGMARILLLADGRRFLRLEGLATSDGPDLHVWVTDQPSGGDWGSYDDGRYVRLGELKATHGDQNYEIPAGADLDGLRSVVVWCDRFDVAFGTAPVAL